MEAKYIRALAVGVGIGAVVALTQLLHPADQKKATPKPQLNDRYNIPGSLSKCEYKEELKVAVECALTAGRAVNAALNDTGGRAVREKGSNDIDFVTEVDVANEKYIFSRLRENFPSHQLVGEESASSSACSVRIPASPTWIVDPIDGTTNFLHSNPNSCVSIGLCVGRQVVVGVIYAPCFDELYICVKGHGAFLNGKKLAVSKAQKVGDSLIATCIGYVRSKEGAADICRWMTGLLLARCRGIREMGSSVLTLCYLAAGRLDAVYGGVAGDGGYPWDYCAASLMITEAGGSVYDINGDAYNVDGRSILATATPELRADILRAVQIA